MRSIVPFVLAAFTVAACAADEVFPDEPKPVWLWTGDEKDAPPCPDGAKQTWDARTNVPPAPDCGACTCTPAACNPSPTLYAPDVTCMEGEGNINLIRADEGWDGGCFVSDFSIPASALSSLRYAPPIVTPCVPSPTPEPPSISTPFARACPADPALTQPAGFVHCMTSKVDAECPSSFSIRREFTQHFVDYRTCAPCECGPPSELKCTVRITAYADTACDQAFDSATLSSTDNPVCHDIESTSTAELTAMTAEVTDPVAGVCTPVQSRSAISGELVRSPLKILCCER